MSYYWIKEGDTLSFVKSQGAGPCRVGLWFGHFTVRALCCLDFIVLTVLDVVANKKLVSNP